MGTSTNQDFQQWLSNFDHEWQDRQREKNMGQWDKSKCVKTIDRESGRTFYTDPDTGETREYHNREVEDGSKIITPEQQALIEAAKKAKQQRELIEKWSGGKKEKFVFVNTNADFSGVPAAMVTRLIYLSTYAAYPIEQKSDTSLGNPLIRCGKQLTRKDLAEVLGISERHSANFIKSVCPQFISEDEAGGLYLVKGLFVRGGLQKKQFVQYQKIYNKGIRKLYKAANGKYHAQLGYIFMMMPYINLEYNILCWNPLETDIQKVCPMSPKQFCQSVGYSLPNLNRLMTIYRDVMFDVNGKQEHFCKIISNWNDQSNAMICINPAVIYSGTGVHRLEVMNIFFNEKSSD